MTAFLLEHFFWLMLGVVAAFVVWWWIDFGLRVRRYGVQISYPLCFLAAALVVWKFLSR